MENILEQLKGKLVVSCQALPDEPLYSSFIMGRMARAAKEGGAAGIRAQSTVDIDEIRAVVDLPVIGLIKQKYQDSEIYITPTMKEVDALIQTGCEMIALDMTRRTRPGGEKIEDLLAKIHAAGRLVLADISTFEEGVEAERLGADAISTTMSGYTPYSPQQEGPDLELIERLVAAVRVPVFAEGRLNSPEDLKDAMARGAYGAIIGGAITRPKQITERFIKALG